MIRVYVILFIAIYACINLGSLGFEYLRLMSLLYFSMKYLYPFEDSLFPVLEAFSFIDSSTNV